MKIQLHGFQKAAVDKLLRDLANARREIDDDDTGRVLQAMLLSAPTGSGKTVIMSALIEAVLDGHPDGLAYPVFPDEHASLLWITDQPELNEQTYKRMMSHLEKRWFGSLQVVDEAMDQETLDPGKLYFINTQKLGKKGLLVRRSDKRRFTFWDTMHNTIAERRSSVYVIIDEAHRGMAESARNRREAESITQRFLKGYDDGGQRMSAAPIVIGVSATSQRFLDVLKATDHVPRKCVVPAQDVRQSGLLKETIRLRRDSSSSAGSNMTLLAAAVGQLREFERAWSALESDSSSGRQIKPIMLVQVEDAPSGASKKDKDAVSATDLSEAYENVKVGLGPGVKPEAFAHAFQDQGKLEVAGIEVRRLAPAQIDDDPDVRVVFFKTALNTGWDCPRAEVMMSFRSAKDATNIAQLVGRMVRTPLRRRVDGPDSDLLNGVDLYLPRYDEDELDRVVKRLTDEDEDTSVPTRVSEVIDLELNPQVQETDECRKLLSLVPTYERVAGRNLSNIRRLMAVSRCLERTSGAVPVLEDASERAEEWILGCMLERFNEFDRTPGSRFAEELENAGRVVVSGKEISSSILLGQDLNGGETRQLEEQHEPVADNDLISEIDRADRELGEGIASAFVKKRIAEKARTGDAVRAPREARLELLALTRLVEDLKDHLEDRAEEKVEEWRRTHEQAIAEISDTEREKLNSLFSPEVRAKLKSLPQTVHERITQTKVQGGELWERHLYSSADCKYETKLNGWERAVLKTELDRDDVVTWFRNRRGGQWCLAIPYRVGDETHLMYPDFVFFRRDPDSGDLVADVLDPHGLFFADAVDKAKGFAEYAATLSEATPRPPVDRLEAIAEVDGAMRRLDMADPELRARVANIEKHWRLEELFDDPYRNISSGAGDLPDHEAPEEPRSTSKAQLRPRRRGQFG